MTAVATSQQQVPKALVVGIDGCVLARVDAIAAPTLRRLRDRQLFTPSEIYPDRTTETSSGPGWSTIGTGTWPAKHGVRDNDMAGHRLGDYPDFVTRAAAAGRSTMCVVDWSPLATTVFRPAAPVDLADPDWMAADAAVTEHALRALTGGAPDVSFVYLGAADEAAHAHGVHSAEYTAALEAIDRSVDRLLAALAARQGEDWLVLVVTDHGHRPEGGHGGQTPAERATFVIGVGAALHAAAFGAARLVDVAPTVLTHCGIAVDPSWGLDGRSLLPARERSVPAHV